MRINANNITHNIINAHMRNIQLNKEDLKTENNFQYGLYTYKKNIIFTQINEKIDFTKQIYIHGKNTFYIDSSSAGHLGVSYVVIKESNLYKKTQKLLINIIIITIIAYIFLSIIGFYLAKLFIYPIQNQREKLNNFIKNTTHELNTPLSAILLCVDSNNFYTQKNKDHIKISAKKISNIYKNLTYLFFKEHKENRVLSQNISNLLEQELQYHKELAHKKNIIISHHIEKTFFKIEKECFERIINNLITNAIKYTKRKGHISITLKNNLLIIEDTGIGISKDNLKRIFERYYRIKNSTGGFGIGLDIVYSICKNYNIKIDVHSKINKGTTFFLQFPFK